MCWWSGVFTRNVAGRIESTSMNGVDWFIFPTYRQASMPQCTMQTTLCHVLCPTINRYSGTEVASVWGGVVVFETQLLLSDGAFGQ